MQRRLAAILAADVVGYSSLMGADQDGTLNALRYFRTEIFGPAVAGYGGKLIKSMGDGWLVEFASAVDAVNCASEVQDQLRGHDLIKLRIGVHIGDVVHEDEDIFGDGVNIAARLEALSEPGAIVVSDAVYGSLDETGRYGFQDAGEQLLKNISRPVRVWHRRQPECPEERKLPKLIDRPSIAVLAFANLTGDPRQDHVADGISEEIMHALSRCRWLIVAARNSSFAFKGRSTDVRTIARKLGVRYALEGAVRRAGGKLRITAQLVEGGNGTRLWGERYDHSVDNIFTLQDEIAETIAGTVEPEISAIEGAALRDQPAEALTAWECFQLGLWHLYHFTEDNLQTSRELLERAIELDPDLSPAYARLAYVHIQLGFYGHYQERAARLDDAIAISRKAIKLDDREPMARVSLGRALAQRGEAESAIAELRAAVNLDPSFAQAHFALAQALTYVDRAEEALVAINEAIRLSPHDPHFWTFLNIRAVAEYIAGDLDAAAEDERAALRQPNATFWPALILVAILGRAGRHDEAAEATAALHRIRPGMTIADAMRELCFTERPFNTRRFVRQFRTDLVAAGLPEGDA